MKVVYVAVSMTFVFALLACGAFAADMMKETKAVITGKIEVKTETLAGKDTPVAYVTVDDAKALDGKSLADMKGKTLKIVGAKAADAEKMAGKEVTISGTLKKDEVMATSVTEKAAAPASTPAPAPAAK